MRRSIAPETARTLLDAVLEKPTYLDKCHALHRAAGAKRLVVLLPFEFARLIQDEWFEEMSEMVTIVWGGGTEVELEANEFTLVECG